MKTWTIRPLSTVSTVFLCGVLALSGSTLASASVPTVTISVNGLGLDGATLPAPSFVIDIAGAGVSATKLKVDGQYIGSDSTSPFAFSVNESVGTHQVDLRTYDADKVETKSTARFTVSSATNPTPTPTPAPTPTLEPTMGTGVVTRSGTQFLLDGQRFRALGVNSYDLADEFVTATQAEQRLAELQALGLNTVRVWAFPRKGLADAAFLSRLDTVVALARKHGMRLILTLGNEWTDWGGYRQFGGTSSTFFSDATVIADYKKYVASVVRPSLRNSPAILAWEVLNEPRPKASSGAWVGNVAGYVKSLDSSHLVFSGGEGFISGVYPQAGAQYPNFQAGADAATLTPSNIDALTVHIYRKYLAGGSAAQISTVVAGEKKLATALNVPLVIEEAGVGIPKEGTPQERAAFMDALAAVSSKTDGTLMWAYGKSHNDDWTMNVGDDTGSMFIRWAKGVVGGTTVPSPSPSPSLPSPSPSPPTSTSPGTLSPRTIPVTNGAGLQTAISTAVPGDRIVLAPGTYTPAQTQFEASSQGTAASPITLVGSKSAILTTGKVSSGGYGLHVTGSHWVLQGFSVTNSKKGIVLDGSAGTVIDSVDVGNVGQEGIHFRANSVDGVLKNSTIHDTGVSTPAYGEGVYVGSANSNWATYSQGLPDRSDRVLIAGNRIVNTAAEGIDVKEGTTGGQLLDNTFTNAGYSGQNYADSWVDLKGNGYLIKNNGGSGTLLDAFQVHSVVSGWGLNNRFIANRVFAGVPGYLLNVASNPKPGGNVVSCSSTASGAAMGLSNILCQ